MDPFSAGSHQFLCQGSRILEEASFEAPKAVTGRGLVVDGDARANGGIP